MPAVTTAMSAHVLLTFVGSGATHGGTLGFPSVDGGLKGAAVMFATPCRTFSPSNEVLTGLIRDDVKYGDVTLSMISRSGNVLELTSSANTTAKVAPQPLLVQPEYNILRGLK